MFDDISEASYARVFRDTLPGKNNRYGDDGPWFELDFPSLPASQHTSACFMNRMHNSSMLKVRD